MENGEGPATKHALEQLRSEMNHHYSDLVERITDSETKLLNAFYGFIESNQKRLSQIESNEGGAPEPHRNAEIPPSRS